MGKFSHKVEEQKETYLREEIRPKRAACIQKGEVFLNQEEESAVRTLLGMYVEIFAFEDEEIRSMNADIVQPYVMRTVPHQVLSENPHPLPFKIKEEALKIMKRKIEKGVLEPCHSPYSNPYWFVPKKKGKLRLVLDLQELSAVTVKDSGLPADADKPKGCLLKRAVHLEAKLMVISLETDTYGTFEALMKCLLRF
jgi:hypothetical protein